MLRPARMMSLRVLTLRSYRPELIMGLHELGMMQITNLGEKLAGPEWERILARDTADEDAHRITSLIVDCNRVLDVFQSTVPPPGVGVVKSMVSPPPPKKVPVEDMGKEALIGHAEGLLGQVTDNISEASSIFFEQQDLIIELQERKKLIENLIELDIDLADVSRGEYVFAMIGLLPAERSEDVQRELGENTDNLYLAEVKQINEEQSALIIAAYTEHLDQLSTSLRRMGFEQIPTHGLSGTPREVVSDLGSRIEEASSRKEDARKHLAECADKWRDDLEAVREMLSIERERAEISALFTRTDETIMLEGWVEKKNAEKTAGFIRELVDNHAIVEIDEPDVPADEIPVKLNNPRFIRSFELLTDMFARPRYDEFDPTILLAPTFLIFYGLMLSDAAYGLFMVLLGALMINGAGRYDRGIRDFGIIITSSGVVTVFFGILTGGFFGDLITEKYLSGMLGGFTFPAYWLEPLGRDPVMFAGRSLSPILMILVLSILVAFIHLNMGIFMGIAKKIKNRKYREALDEQVWLLFFQPGVLLVLGNSFLKLNMPEYLASMGMMLIVISLILLLTKFERPYINVMGLFDVTGFIGDVLSYTRLLALCLATAGIAMTWNLLAGMVYPVPFIGVILAVMIFTVGHLFNMVMNGLGSFVHSIRLHYVEFFSKFYEGGGREFIPFQIKREITLLKTGGV